MDGRAPAQRQDDPQARDGSLTRDGREGTVLLKPNAHGLPHAAANQPPPIALSEAQMCAGGVGDVPAGRFTLQAA